MPDGDLNAAIRLPGTDTGVVSSADKELTFRGVRKCSVHVVNRTTAASRAACLDAAGPPLPHPQLPTLCLFYLVSPVSAAMRNEASTYPMAL